MRCTQPANHINISPACSGSPPTPIRWCPRGQRVKKRSMWRLFECFKIPTHLTRGHSHFLRQLTQAHRTKHLIRACATDPALACGNVDKIRFVILGAFPLNQRVADFLIESRSAPLRIRKSFPCPFSWWTYCYPWFKSRYTALVADWCTIAGSQERSVLPRHAGRRGYGSRYKKTHKSMSSQ